MRRLSLIAFLILLTMGVYADTSYPVPGSMSLGRGESYQFQFQVQNIRGTTDIKCSYAIERSAGLELSFPEETFIKAGGRQNVVGEVRAPRNLEDGNYTARFCVHCQSAVENAGNTVRMSDCGLPVNVVIGRIPREVAIGLSIWVLIIPVILVLLVVLVVIIVYFLRRRNKYPFS